jgi:dihydrofolate reductase
MSLFLSFHSKKMPALRVHSFSVSLDGYGAGPDQSRENPLGVGGESLHEWIVATRSFHQMAGKPGGTTGTDDEFVARGLDGIGAWILGRNMFGPIRGPWPDESWKGWWGARPPYHVPVYVLTHFPRPALVMEGGTTFHFVTDGLTAAIAAAREAAGNQDIRIGGGASTIRQALQARLIDQMHIAIAPVLLGSGESLLGGLNLLELGYNCSEHVPTAGATHVVFVKR